MRNFLRTISGLLIAGAAMSGCAVGPDYRSPATPTPDSWQSAAAPQTPDAARLASWWTTLNDPLLNEFIEQAIAQSPTVAQARARLAAASFSANPISG